MSVETKNTLAKIIVVIWIFTLLLWSFWIATASITFDPNAFFGLSAETRLAPEVVREMKVLLLMLAVSIVG